MMRWEDERYVRVYTRDTVDWLALSWDAQALLLHLLRKVDRAGLLPLTRHGKKGVAVAVGHPMQWSRIEPALEELLADGCIEIRANVLFFRNFIAAQETPQSDKQRKAESRARAADLAAAATATNPQAPSQNVTHGHKSGQIVTPGHTASRGVTPGHSVPYRAVPYRAVPSQDLPPSAGASAAPEQAGLPGVEPPTPPATPAKKVKEAKKPEPPTDPRHATLVAALTAEGWPFDGGKDAANVKGLLALADQQEATNGELAVPEVLRRARIAWGQFPDFHSARTLTQLRMKWGEFAASLGGGGSGTPAAVVPMRRLVEM
jgi:hypothetical protein